MNDTQTLRVEGYLEDGETLIPQASIISANFTVLAPGDDPTTPSISGVGGTIEGDGTARYTAPTSLHTISGVYKGFGTFTYTEDGETRTQTVPFDYDVLDTFERSGSTPADPAIDACWIRLEDIFDSEQGGPWLRDMTLRYFDKDKLSAFVPQVIMEINLTTPFSNDTPDTFAYDGNGTQIVAQGLLVATIRHLIRSYTEQPDRTNSPVPYLNRRDYQQRWSVVLEIELATWNKLLPAYKATFFDLSSSSMLVSSKAGRLFNGALSNRRAGPYGYF